MQCRINEISMSKQGLAKLPKHPRGASMIKVLFVLLILGILGGMVTYVYFAWQKADLSDIAGREKIIKNETFIGGTDVYKKLLNAYNGNYVVTLTEEELNLYIAKRLKMTQGGPIKGFTKIKGVYVDLKPDLLEVFVEREIAQYGEDGKPKTEYLKPFDQTISMKFKIYTIENANDGGTTNMVEFPGGKIGKSPAPGMFVKVVKPTFDALNTFFEKELDLAYGRIVSIKIEDGKVTLDPRKRYKQK